MRIRLSVFLIILTALSLVLPTPVAKGQSPVVRAVLFFSKDCGHCEIVIQEVLPPLVDKYQDKLDIIGIDISQQAGSSLYQAAVSRFTIPEEKRGIPTLIVGDYVLVGSEEIPAIFPSIIENGIAAGGIDWPDIPGLKEALTAQIEAVYPGSPKQQVTSTKPGFINKFLRDPLANSIAVVILLAMLVSLVWVGFSFIKGTKSPLFDWPNWVIPVLAIIGAAIAGYLTFIEVSKTQAICGPVGDCNSVQESPYATLFGVLPVGMLGLIGYIGILLAWLVQKYGPENLEKISSLAIWGMAWFGVLFSVYLTFLEPFVIGATCAWCIASAIVITMLLLGSTERAKVALKLDEFEEEFSSEEDQEEFSDLEASAKNQA